MYAAFSARKSPIGHHGTAGPNTTSAASSMPSAQPNVTAAGTETRPDAIGRSLLTG
jgi:hypothetical protein